MLPTGEQFEIRAGDVHAIVTEVGAGLRALRHGDRHLIETFAEDARPARGMGAVLVPWPNRTAHGRWQLERRRRSSSRSPSPPRATPSTGCCATSSTRSASARTTPSRWSPSSRRSRAGRSRWPRASATPSTGHGLTVTHTVRNVGPSRVPFGVGAHPYLRAGDAPIDDCVLTVAAATTIPLDGGLPTGPATAVPAELDLRGRPPGQGARPRQRVRRRGARRGRHPRPPPPRRAGRHHRAVGRPRVRLRAGVHPAGPGRPGPRRGRRTDDLPARRAQLRRRPDHARPGRDLVGQLGNSATGGNMKVFNGLDELRAAAGTHVGASDWMTIDQSRVDMFADATDDHQWIHVDPEKGQGRPVRRHRSRTASSRCRCSPCFIAAGLPHRRHQDGRQLRAQQGALHRARPGRQQDPRAWSTWPTSSDAKGGAVQVTTRVTVEIEGSERPALVAEWITRQYA